MIFTEQAPFDEAIRSSQVRAVLPTSLNTADLSRIKASLRERALFASGVLNALYLQEIKSLIESILSPETVIKEGVKITRGITTDTARATLKELFPGELPDGRINLILRTQVDMATGYGYWQRSQSPVSLELFPGLELYRGELRDEPRDWPTRWKEAGGEFFPGPSDYEEGRMIALKNDPIWEKISRFGTPYEPFDFNSGMVTRQVDRQELVELGFDVDDFDQESQERDLNEDLESAAELDEDMQEAILESLGDGYSFVGGVLIKNRIENSKGYDPSQPRDDDGQWTSGGRKSLKERLAEKALMKEVKDAQIDLASLEDQLGPDSSPAEWHANNGRIHVGDTVSWFPMTGFTKLRRGAQVEAEFLGHDREISVGVFKVTKGTKDYPTGKYLVMERVNDDIKMRGVAIEKAGPLHNRREDGDDGHECGVGGPGSGGGFQKGNTCAATKGGSKAKPKKKSTAQRRRDAKKHSVARSKEDLDLATKTERHIADLLPGGDHKGSDNGNEHLPFDVETTTNKVEVKTIIAAKNDKIKMHSADWFDPIGSRNRKVLDAVKDNKPAYTVVADRRNNLINKPRYYVKAGVGSFRLTSMERVSESQLKAWSKKNAEIISLSHQGHIDMAKLAKKNIRGSEGGVKFWGDMTLSETKKYERMLRSARRKFKNEAGDGWRRKWDRSVGPKEAKRILKEVKSS